MTGTVTIDPELRPALDFFPPMDLTVETLPTLRAGLAQTMAPVTPSTTTTLAVTEHHVPGPAGAPPVRVIGYRPRAAAGPVPAILHIHAGGFVLGSPDMMNEANATIAVDLGCAVFSVDYRLAPEARYPAAIEDCYATLAWLVTEAAVLGIDPARIGVKGESAGGGLAAALALLARDRGEFALAFQHLHYPMLDDRTALGPASAHATDLVWSIDQNAFGWRALLGDAVGGAEVPAHAAPARAADLAGLPPAFITIPQLDVLAPEGVDYAGRLIAAGVPVELHVFPHAFHAFDFAAEARTAIAARRLSRDALHRALHG